VKTYRIAIRDGSSNCQWEDDRVWGFASSGVDSMVESFPLAISHTNFLQPRVVDTVMDRTTIMVIFCDQ